jgi:hypothetical protein
MVRVTALAALQAMAKLDQWFVRNSRHQKTGAPISADRFRSVILLEIFWCFEKLERCADFRAPISARQFALSAGQAFFRQVGATPRVRPHPLFKAAT